VADFGLALNANEEHAVTRAGEAVCTELGPSGGNLCTDVTKVQCSIIWLEVCGESLDLISSAIRQQHVESVHCVAVRSPREVRSDCMQLLTSELMLEPRILELKALCCLYHAYRHSALHGARSGQEPSEGPP
jgi:hypothetical protein